MERALWIGLGIYVFALNLILFRLMCRDKQAAERHGERIPEATLTALAVLGGSLGGILGILLFHHKTQKPAFAVGFPLTWLVQATLALWMWKMG